jgi:hypothetical protein
MTPLRCASDDTLITRAGALARRDVDQQIGQQKVAHMVQRPCQFDAIGADLPRGEKTACIIDQHIKALMPLQKCFRNRTDTSL